MTCEPVTLDKIQITRHPLKRPKRSLAIGFTPKDFSFSLLLGNGINGRYWWLKEKGKLVNPSVIDSVFFLIVIQQEKGNNKHTK